MRNRKLFCCLALVVAAGLLAAPQAMATGCSSFNPTVTVIAGPCPVDSATPTACLDLGPYTGIKYQVTGASADHAVVLVTSNNQILPVSGRNVFAECVGDNLTGLGKYSCNEKTVRVNGSGNTGQFWIVVEGQKSPVLQSIALKKGGCVKSFAVTGLGFDVNQFRLAQKFETINFKGCAYDFAFDSLTGEVFSTQFNESQSTLPQCTTSGQQNCCSEMIVTDVANLSLTLNTPSGQIDLGDGQFGEGYVSSGVNSCTTRVIGGKVYTWGSPCP